MHTIAKNEKRRYAVGATKKIHWLRFDNNKKAPVSRGFKIIRRF